MLILFGFLVIWAVALSVRHIVKDGLRGPWAIITAFCAGSLVIAFAITCVVLIDPSPVLWVMHTDVTGAMVVSAVVMAVVSAIAGCSALVCGIRKIKTWIWSFVLLAVACAFQGALMFYLLFLH
jgi:hypothetical protein